MALAPTKVPNIVHLPKDFGANELEAYVDSILLQPDYRHRLFMTGIMGIDRPNTVRVKLPDATTIHPTMVKQLAARYKAAGWFDLVIEYFGEWGSAIVLHRNKE